MSDLYPALELIAHDTTLPVATVCEVLDVSRSALLRLAQPGPGRAGA